MELVGERPHALGREVLGHEGDMNPVGEVVGEPAEAVEAVLHLPREDEVADYHSSESEAVVVGWEAAAFLAEHLEEGLLGTPGIVGGVGIAGGEVGVHVLEIRQIDVDIRREGAERVGAVVAVGVVDGGGEEAAGVEGVEDGRDEVGVVRGGDKTEHVLRLRQQFCNAVNYFIQRVVEHFICINTCTRDDVVLTEETLEIAVGEKEVDHAAGAGDGGFLAAVYGDGGDVGAEGGVAEAEAVGAVGAALTWAEGAAVGDGCGHEWDVDVW